MPHTPPASQRPWSRKFHDAFRGIAVGIAREKSFRVHLAVTLLVLLAAAAFRLPIMEWCVLLLSIAMVLTAELFNTALERLGKTIDTKTNPLLGEALDISSGAVLLASLGAASVGLIVFTQRALEYVTLML